MKLAFVTHHVHSDAHVVVISAFQITRHKNADPPEPEQPRGVAVHAHGRWISGPDVQTELPVGQGAPGLNIAGAPGVHLGDAPSGTRSLRMTLHVPVGALSALMSVNPGAVIQSHHAPARAPGPAPPLAAVPRALPRRMPNIVLPRALPGPAGHVRLVLCVCMCVRARVYLYVRARACV